MQEHAQPGFCAVFYRLSLSFCLSLFYCICLYHCFKAVEDGEMLELKTRKMQKTIEPESGLTLLDHALKHEVDWGFSCARGTCARCRCFIVSGGEFLAAPTEAEVDRLEPEEIEQGFRLACQCVVKQAGHISVTHKPYF
jgi:2Fe-2S ferredoxin